MTDITKCSGFKCPIKDKCKRYTASPSSNQSMFVKPPIKKGKCDMFWGSQSEHILVSLKDIFEGKLKKPLK